MRFFLLALFLLPQAFAFRLAFLGDFGAPTPGRAQVAAALRAYHAAHPLAALFTLGDNFYPRGEVVEAYLKDLPPVPLHPAFGNHDAPRLGDQLRRFGLERPYYRVGFPGLAVYVLYSEGELAQQRAWLEAGLSREKAPLRLLLLHRPLYSSGLHGGSPTLRALFEPLLLAHGVPLVLAGHDHHYERLEAKGVTHVVSGGGGAWLRAPLRPLAYSRVRATAHHFLVLEVEGGGFRLTAWGADLKPLDVSGASP
ncbi:MAG: metallophosphoesterase [Thermus sp.]|uniref:metallophosphoesterase family protein n=1 Tax=Thermus sp. TaxID=275 RepID=UPI0030B37D99